MDFGGFGYWRTFRLQRTIYDGHHSSHIFAGAGNPNTRRNHPGVHKRGACGADSADRLGAVGENANPIEFFRMMMPRLVPVPEKR